MKKVCFLCFSFDEKSSNEQFSVHISGMIVVSGFLGGEKLWPKYLVLFLGNGTVGCGENLKEIRLGKENKKKIYSALTFLLHNLWV